MPNKDKKILKHTNEEKSVKALFIIYADLECLLEKMNSCKNNLEKSYIEQKLWIHPLIIQCLPIVHLIQLSCI